MLIFISLQIAYDALQVGSFWDIQQDGMVFGLSADLDQAQGAVGVKGGVGEHFEEIRLADVIGAGAGDEDSARAKHFQGAKVEFFVAAQGGVEVALGFGEGGRVENDGVVAAVGRGIVLEQVEGVGFDPFDFLIVEQPALSAAFWSATSRAGRELSMPVTFEQQLAEVEGEASLIAEDVEGFAVRVLGGGGVVFALVEEGTGLLAFERVVVKLHAVHGESGGGLTTLQQAGCARRKSFQFAYARIHAFDDRNRMEAVELVRR